MCFVSSVWQQIIEWISWSELGIAWIKMAAAAKVCLQFCTYSAFPYNSLFCALQSSDFKGNQIFVAGDKWSYESIDPYLHKICSVTRIVKVLCVQDFVSPIFRSRSVTSGSNTSELVILTVSVLDNNKLISYSQGHQFSCCLVTHIVGWFEYCFLLLGC